MKKLLHRLTAPLGVVGIIAAYEPHYLVYALPQIAVNAVLPLLFVYFPKQIIAKLADGSAYGAIAQVIVLFVGLLLLLNGANAILQNRTSLAAERFAGKLKNQVGTIAMGLRYGEIESNSFRSTIQLANNASGLTQVLSLAQGIAANIITIAGLAFIIVRLNGLFLLLVSVTLAIKIIFVHMKNVYWTKMRVLEAQNNRLGNYLLDIAYFSEGGAKEIRTNSLQRWFMEKIRGYRNTMVSMQYRIFRRTALYNSITAVITAVQSLVILWVLSAQYIARVISIADFTMYFSAVTALTAALSSVTEKIGDYNQQMISASDYQKAAGLKMRENGGPNDDAQKYTGPFGHPDKIEIAFHGVSFIYPNTHRRVLDNINIKITDREKLVVVGLNGAGKTTFIKLLCKFYRPTTGKITLNGTDIWEIPNDWYYRMIAAVFQDFANFPFCLAENVSMCENAEQDNVYKIVMETGLGEYVKNLPDGLNTYITKSFASGGVELSGGQGQKIAIARAVYKDTPVLILDEPTASLDPKAESEIYTNFFNMAKDKTTIFISHRLAASTIADRIAVFSDGKIAECGAHGDLMKKNGIYAEMYRKQSHLYINEKAIF